MLWERLVHAGDLPLTLAAAAAIAIWLGLGRGWRSALTWSMLFAVGIGLVAASKVAFLAWGTPLPGSGFNAISGHATGVSAVAPVLLFLMAGPSRPALRRWSIAAGLTLGALMSGLLVTQGDHSVAEVTAGWGLGTVIGLGGIGLTRAMPRTPGHALQWSALAFTVTLLAMHAFPFGYVMHRAAHAVAGRTSPMPFNAPTRECRLRPEKETSCLSKRCVVPQSRGSHSSVSASPETITGIPS